MKKHRGLAGPGGSSGQEGPVTGRNRSIRGIRTGVLGHEEVVGWMWWSKRGTMSPFPKLYSFTFSLLKDQKDNCL